MREEISEMHARTHTRTPSLYLYTSQTEKILILMEDEKKKEE